MRVLPTLFSFLCCCVRANYAQQDVRMPPYITAQGVPATGSFDVIFRVDDTIELECTAAGNPVPSYSWTRNGATYSMNQENRKMGPNGKLSISSAATADEGFYQCIVENMYGKTLSRTYNVRRAVLDATAAGDVAKVEVIDGTPFTIHVQNSPKCYPKPTFSWELAENKVDDRPTSFHTDRRVQLDEKGNLWFAYAKPEDALNTPAGSRIYKATIYNPNLDIKTGGSYSQVVVKANLEGVKQFKPVAAYSTATPVVAVLKRDISIKCIFSGNPEPTVTWRRKSGSLPVGRHEIDQPIHFGTKLEIKNILLEDEGDYICKGENIQGQGEREIQINVQAAPEFQAFDDGPQNKNATEKDDVTFHCNAHAIPEASIRWYRNGELLRLDSLPTRISVSPDKKSLTIRQVCRDCPQASDNRITDLMVIQCNASNIHGYAYGSGYLNILKKTKVTLFSENSTSVEVHMKTEATVSYDCQAESDPSTGVSPKWYNITKPDNTEAVYADPPGLTLEGGRLTITVTEEAVKNWQHYGGRYRCVANNGYSEDEKVVEINVKDLPPVVAPQTAGGSWMIYILIIVFIILLLLIFIFCCCLYLHRNRGDKYDVDEKERQNGNDPVKELGDHDFQDYKRPEDKGLKGSQASLGSSIKLNSDEEASLNEYGDDPGKFTEDGSFMGAYTADRKRGRSEDA